MSEQMLIATALALVAVFFGLLMTVIGFMGAKLINQVEEMSKNIVKLAGELHTRITGLDIRLTRVEAIESVCPASPGRRLSDREKEKDHGNS